MFLAVRGHLGRRGSALLAFAVLDVVYGISLAWPAPGQVRPGSALGWFSEIAPLDVWAFVWWTVAAICVVAVVLTLLRRGVTRADRYAFSAAIGIKIWWGTLSLIGWIMREVPISSAGIWLGLAFLVALIAGWPEPEPLAPGEASDG